MTVQRPPEGEQDSFEIVFELPPSPQGAYQDKREDGTTVHGDASGEWTHKLRLFRCGQVP